MRWVAIALGGLLSGAAFAAACNGMPANDGLTEPIQISGGQFISGPLPGSPPPDGGNGSSDGGTDAGGGDGGLPPLSVTSVIFTNPFIVSGISGTGISGLATNDAVAVGVALANRGTGYWVVPTLGQDIEFPGQRDFSFTASFNPDDVAGDTDLRVVAIGASDNGGVQYNAPLCIESRVPDNGHACIAAHPVPAAVFTLRWDAAFDLDLTVITPSGLNVNPKGVTITAPVDGGIGPLPHPEAVGLYDTTAGVIDRDSMGGCVVDGWREEDLVFLNYPATGLYDIYADPFASCGQPAVRFTLTIYEAGGDGNLHATFTRSGELLASQTTGGALSDGGSAAGLFVAEKQFE
jgi:hypothetical protein